MALKTKPSRLGAATTVIRGNDENDRTSSEMSVQDLPLLKRARRSRSSRREGGFSLAWAYLNFFCFHSPRPPGWPQQSMYFRIKREILTLFFTVDASTMVDELKARVFDSVAFQVDDQESLTPGERPVVGTVVCEPSARVSSAGDITLALCRCLPDENKSDRTAEDWKEREADVRVETRILAGNATIADSNLENDDVLCIVLPGENAESVFRKTLAIAE